MRILIAQVATVAIIPALLAVLCLSDARAQASNTPISPDEALRRAAANEQRLKEVEREYSYRVDVLVQTFGEAGSITGQLHRLSLVTNDDLGNRTEKILEYPPSRLAKSLNLAKPDARSLVGLDPFFLTPQMLPHYRTSFVGRERIDELNTYVFELSPAEKFPYEKRDGYLDRPLKGKIWIDDQDLQIVKVEGLAVSSKNERDKFPRFEFYREDVDGKYWLPSYLYSRDVLPLGRFDLPIKIQVRYSDYRRITSRR
jgi:hypothetical protein